MKTPAKRTTHHLVTFNDGDDNEAVALAMLGLSNKAIKGRTKLSDSQITYRLHKAKTVEENKLGYRVDYRNGTSPMAVQIINDLAGIMREEVRRNVTPKLVHPTPRTVKL